ncbi:MAG TPA: polysaccharide deacetylase family protein [Solirubrobacter sp.]|nr:polysaccharide deacetylase family protein [Solirubrobacter sp.]
MWRRRVLAIAALALVAIVAVIVLRPSSSPPVTATAAKTPTAMPAKTAAKPRAARPQAPRVTGAAARRKRVPILMYHVISAAPPGVANAELWVDRHVFASQMQALARAGYEAVTLRQAWDGWRTGAPLPRKPIVVSFDDGYLSQYTHAKPVLRRLGWPGVLNLEIKSIGPGGLTTKQIKSMLAAGWELDSHTVTHPDLTTLDDASLKRELVDSRRELHERFDVPVDFFAYPAGRFDARVEAATRAAGYAAATTTIEGVASRSDDPFALPRVRVNASDTAASLLARLRGTG